MLSLLNSHPWEKVDDCFSYPPLAEITRHAESKMWAVGNLGGHAGPKTDFEGALFRWKQKINQLVPAQQILEVASYEYSYLMNKLKCSKEVLNFICLKLATVVA